MTEPTPYALTQLFSQLAGRDVSFSLVLNPAPSKARPIYGAYSVLPGESTLVVKTDLPMLGCLAGALLGLPDETAVERALATPMNEFVRDAIHEVLNIASTALSTNGRAVFKNMATDPAYCAGEALSVVESPDMKSNYSVSIDGQVSGLFTILSQF